MATVFFTQGPVTNMAEAGASDGEAFAEFFHKMIEQGIYPPPSPFEAWFVSLAHTPADIEATVECGVKGLSQLAGLRLDAAEACALTSRRGRFETGPGLRRDATLIARGRRTGRDAYPQLAIPPLTHRLLPVVVLSVIVGPVPQHPLGV